MNISNNLIQYVSYQLSPNTKKIKKIRTAFDNNIVTHTIPFWLHISNKYIKIYLPACHSKTTEKDAVSHWNMWIELWLEILDWNSWLQID